jgi:DNA (cytosine-5)-methyltransferase 1
MRPPVAIDLFSGCGGLTLGLKQAGFNVVGAVEIDLLSVETYRANHNEVRVWDTDICKVGTDDVLRETGLKVGELDLLAGCPPCQGFSSMRTLNGGRAVNDPRNDLIFEFLRFAKELKPKTVMMENVPGLITDGRMLSFREELQKLGYQGEPQILNAADYGVPQRRRRMVYVGSRLGYIAPSILPTKRKTVRETISTLPSAGESGDPLHDLPEKRSPAIIDIIKRIPKDGGSRRSDLGEEFQLNCHKKFGGFKDVYARMWWDDVAPTMTGGCVNPSKGRFLHPEFDRAITLREAALLQSFPPDYFFSLKRGKYPAALLIGNALPPEFVRQHALRLIFHLREMGQRL